MREESGRTKMLYGFVALATQPARDKKNRLPDSHLINNQGVRNCNQIFDGVKNLWWDFKSSRF
jgi:hypothetical protein